MIRQFYEDLIVIKRLKARSVLDKISKGYVCTATADASIQPLGKEGGELSEGVFGRTFIAYVELGTPVKQGDRVKDQNGTQYDVTEVVEREFGAFPYIEIIMKKTT